MSGVELREGVVGGGGEGDEGMGGDEGAAMSTSCEGGGGEGCTMVDGGFCGGGGEATSGVMGVRVRME